MQTSSISNQLMLCIMKIRCANLGCEIRCCHNCVACLQKPLVCSQNRESKIFTKQQNQYERMTFHIDCLTVCILVIMSLGSKLSNFCWCLDSEVVQTYCFVFPSEAIFQMPTAFSSHMEHWKGRPHSRNSLHLPLNGGREEKDYI